jgi:predicted nucleic acid-binding protein
MMRSRRSLLPRGVIAVRRENRSIPGYGLLTPRPSARRWRGVSLVVIDACAGVELVADMLRGRARRALSLVDAVAWVPELFFVECGAVLGRWDLNRILTHAQVDQAIDALMGWPLPSTRVRGLFADAWRLRANVTFADAVYVASAGHLGAEVLSEDRRLANTPGLPVRVSHLPH